MSSHLTRLKSQKSPPRAGHPACSEPPAFTALSHLHHPLYESFLSNSLKICSIKEFLTLNVQVAEEPDVSCAGRGPRKRSIHQPKGDAILPTAFLAVSRPEAT